MNNLRGNITFDTSAIIEYMMGTELGQIIKEYFETIGPKEKAFCSLYALSEIFYVLCRSKGTEYATEKINEMLGSRVLEINNTLELALETGALKCERALAIGDCSCIATAKITKSRAIFAQEEKELAREIKKKALPTEITFLSELDKIRKKSQKQVIQKSF